MPRTIQHPGHRAVQSMAEAQNGVDALTSQQSCVVSAPQAGAPTSSQSPAPVIQTGIPIVSTPAGTPGPSSGVRYGAQYFDSNGALAVQIDQYGWHFYNAGVYAGEMAGYAPVTAVGAWIAPTLENGWINAGSPYSTAGYMKDPFGFVHLKGLITAGTSGSVPFTLPSGYAPAAYERLAGAPPPSDIAQSVVIQVDTDGSVTVTYGGTGSASLTCAPFFAA